MSLSEILSSSALFLVILGWFFSLRQQYYFTMREEQRQYFDRCMELLYKIQTEGARYWESYTAGDNFALAVLIARLKSYIRLSRLVEQTFPNTEIKKLSRMLTSGESLDKKTRIAFIRQYSEAVIIILEDAYSDKRQKFWPF